MHVRTWRKSAILKISPWQANHKNLAKNPKISFAKILSGSCTNRTSQWIFTLINNGLPCCFCETANWANSRVKLWKSLAQIMVFFMKITKSSAISHLWSTIAWNKNSLKILSETDLKIIFSRNNKLCQKSMTFYTVQFR